MGQPTVIDVEIRIDDRLAPGAEERRLRPQPLARLLLAGEFDEARLEPGDDVGV
jgi:hypothetical protein